MLSTKGDLQGPDDANRALQARVTIHSRWEREGFRQGVISLTMNSFRPWLLDGSSFRRSISREKSYEGMTVIQTPP